VDIDGSGGAQEIEINATYDTAGDHDFKTTQN